MLVNQNHFRKYNMHWVSPKAFGAQITSSKDYSGKAAIRNIGVSYEDAAAKNNIK